MPVPFRYDDELEHLGSAAFLCIDPDGDDYRGALFLIDARGEPLEFAYNRVEVLNRFLWKSDQLRRHVARRLAATLLEICPRIPSVLLCRADEVEPEVFSQDLHLTIPVARVAGEATVVGQSAAEELEELTGAALQMFWVGSAPDSESTERRLVDELTRRGLLIEPFERARAGLAEVYDHPTLVD